MSKRILVLDDDADTLNTVAEVLNYEGFEVRAELNTDNIVDLIKHYSPDLVMVDYLLKGVNGGELCNQIKKDGKTAHIPVIIVSAYPRLTNSLGRYGCNAFIAKPFDLENLVQQINELT
jgi:CheY-like chemotaxis protein